MEEYELSVPLTCGWVSSSVTPKSRKGKKKKDKPKEPLGFYQRKKKEKHNELD